MSENIKVGTILIKTETRPGMPPLETEPCFGEWSIVKAADAFALDRQIHAAGWSFFFIAAKARTMFLGVLAPGKIQNALKRIAARMKSQHFNSLEVTEITARRFLGVPYVTVSAHPRHLQQNCNLETFEARQISDNAAALV
jgi:hypothetical protein